MTNSYRRALVWVRDGKFPSDVWDKTGYYESSTPDARKFAKRINRRDERRENEIITRSAVHEYYSETDDAEFDEQDEFEGLYDEYDLELQREDDDFLYDPYPYEPYDDYGDLDDWYSSRSYTRREETPYDRIVKQEDAGKSLGELLEEIAERKAARA